MPDDFYIFNLCDMCESQMLWMVYDNGQWHVLTHADEMNELHHRRAMKAVHQLLLGRLAARSGHTVTFRFFPQFSWTECTCGWHGCLRADSGTSCTIGRGHLVNEGAKLMQV